MTSDRARPVHRLAASRAPLRDAYDLVILDLDGVVYIGADAVPNAVDTLTALRVDATRLAYITNNASRPPEEVADHLVRLGLDVESSDVVTSAQAVARLIAAEVRPGATILTVGGAGLAEALTERGLVTTATADDDPAAVVQGFDRSVGWSELAEAGYAIQSGVPWFASNTDVTIPTARGLAPGNGTLVGTVAAVTGLRPRVAGKPEPALFDETMIRVGGTMPIMVGDRLDTDIAGANNVGFASLAVLTGISDIAEISAAPPELRPTFVGPDLRALLRAQPPVTRDGDGFVCLGVRASRQGDAVEIAGDADAGVDDYDHAIATLRAAVTAAWESDDPPVTDVSQVVSTIEKLVR